MRRAWIDWLRGVAVLIMFHAHVIDAWTLKSDRTSWWYHQSVRVAGMAAPLFLFLAGVSVVLAASALTRKGHSVASASRALRRRGWEILGLALLFRLQSWLINPGTALTGMLKVDILNIMGPSMVVAAWVWGRSTRDVTRLVLFAVATALVVAATPWMRTTPLVSGLPDALEWYLRPPAGKGWFALFPWAALLLVGGLIGVVIDRTRDRAAERRLAVAFALGGPLAAAAGYAMSFYPPLIAGTSFWTTSVSYFIIRLGLMVSALAIAWWWMARPAADAAASPMIQMGRTSLFLYWVHVELAYGVLSYPIRGKMPFWAAMVAFVAFSLAMLHLSYAKDRLVARWKASPPPRMPAAA